MPKTPGASRPVRERKVLERRLRQLYYEKGWTQTQIASYYNVGFSTVIRWFKAFGMKGRHPRDARTVKVDSELPAMIEGVVLEGFDDEGMPLLADPNTGQPVPIIGREDAA